jgi:hypothetical protein
MATKLKQVTKSTCGPTTRMPLPPERRPGADRGVQPDRRRFVSSSFCVHPPSPSRSGKAHCIDSFSPPSASQQGYESTGTSVLGIASPPRGLLLLLRMLKEVEKRFGTCYSEPPAVYPTLSGERRRNPAMRVGSELREESPPESIDRA